MLPQEYFPVVGSVPKKFSGHNRRKVDMIIAQFEDDRRKEVDRVGWGLPHPNIEAAYSSLAKYAKSTPAMNPKQIVAWNESAEFMAKHFGPYMQGARVKTLEEAMSGIDMSTSPGFPWTREYATKRAMVDDWKEFPRYMEEDWDRLKEDGYTAVFGNSLKEEIRPADKIASNSIRTFTAGPIEMTLNGNRLFEDMNQKFYKSHLKTASVVGSTPLKGGWEQLMRKLRKFQNGFALDESQYDSSLRAHLMWSIARFRWQMLRSEDQTPENEQRLKVYYRNLINTMILTSEGVLILKTGGNPSGSVNTISDNTLILFMLLAYAWLMIAPIHRKSYADFDANLALALCGDDNTWTVSDEAVEFFNARSVIAIWKDIGVTTTTDCLDPRPLDELDFLSAHTVYIEGQAVPIYDRNKLLTSLLYSRSPGDPAMAICRASAILRVGWADDNMRDYLNELIQYILEEYGDVLSGEPDWQLALTQIPTHEECRALILGRRESYPLKKQSYRSVESLKSCIKDCFKERMEVIALPQRSQRKRKYVRPQPKGRRLVARKVGRPRVKARNRRPRKGRGPRQGMYGGMGQSVGSTQSLARAGGKALRGGVGVKQTDRMIEREFIATIPGSVAYANQLTIALNPGLVASFPWLSIEAAGWESYRFNKLRFCYYTRKGSTTDGSVIMGPDYDPADAAPPDEATFTQYQDVKEFAPWMDEVCVDLSAQQLNKIGRSKFIRSGAVPGNAVIADYDSGNFFIATTGMADTSNVGKLWVEYDVTFETKQRQSGVVAPANTKVSEFIDNAPSALVSATPANLPLATVQTNGLAAVNTAGSIVLPAGNYVVDGDVHLNAATNLTVAIVRVLKNAGLIGTASQTNIAAGAVMTDTSLHVSDFISVNGTDTLTLNAQCNGTGALTGQGTLRIIAV